LFGKALLEPFKAVACLAGAAFISWRLLLFSLLLAPLAALLIRTLARSIKRANRRAMEENAQLMGVLSEAFQGMQTVKAFTMEKHERLRFHLVSKKCLRKAMRIALYNALAKPATEILGLAMIFTALIAGAYLVLNQETHILGIRMTDRPISVAALLCFYGLLVGASDPARRLSDLLNGLQAGVAAADRLFPLLDRQPQIADPADPKPLPHSFLRLSFQHVDFHYVVTGPAGAAGSGFHVKAGETLCIVGPNGCGKSTLVGLLPQVLRSGRAARSVWTGSICASSGCAICASSSAWSPRRRCCSMTRCSTTSVTAHGTRRPSRYMKPPSAPTPIASSWIRWNTGTRRIVGPGGGKLSGGQRQRIALARVDPPRSRRC
jgi:ATP-binding cassette, subfamily B, bacterial MsbA